jgi:RNA polymerase sigma-32 factor
MRSSRPSIVERYLASLGEIRPLDPETERTLAIAWRQGDGAAGRRLIEACLPFVIGIAREYRRWGVPLEDLVQQGNLGLLRAAERFDPDRECRLVTYAAYWIRAEIREYVVRSYRIVRLGSTRTERRAMRAFRRRGADSAAELAERSGMPVARAEKLFPLLAHGDLSLDFRYDDRSPAVERVDGGLPSPEEIAVGRDRARGVEAVLSRALRGLSDREVRIVRERLLADEPVTLSALGHEMGVSKERVRQLEERLRTKLRHELAAFAPAA